MSDQSSQNSESTALQIDRRSAIKRGIAAGATVGAVWSAPAVKRLSLRPAYASAQSSTSGQACITFNGNVSMNANTTADITVEIDGVPVPAPSPSGNTLTVPICGAGSIKVTYVNDAYNQRIQLDLEPKGGTTSGNSNGIAENITLAPGYPGPIDVSGTGNFLQGSAGSSLPIPGEPGQLKATFTYTCGPD